MMTVMKLRYYDELPISDFQFRRRAVCTQSAKFRKQTFEGYTCSALKSVGPNFRFWQEVPRKKGTPVCTGCYDNERTFARPLL